MTGPDEAGTQSRDGDARIARLAKRRGLAIVLLTAAPTLYLVGRLMLGPGHPLGEGCSGGAADFCVFWGAAKLALSGEALTAFDHAALARAAGNLDGGWFPWLHPPGTLAVFAPLGSLPASVAWVLFAAVSMLALAVALPALDGGRWSVRADAMLAPALLPALMLGQFTVLWIAGFFAAFGQLRAGRSASTGVLIGLLTMKPTLGLLIPVALIACGAWRAILWACVTTTLLHGGATMLFGRAYWSAMADAYREHTAHLLETLPALDRMASLPALLTRSGMAAETAVLAQAGLTLALAALVFAVWRQRDAGFDRKLAVLCAAVPLATPYLWYYDAAMTLPAALCLVRAGLLAPAGAGMAGYVALWLGPGAILWLGALGGAQQVPSSLLLLPLMLVALALALRPLPVAKRG